MYDPLVFRRRLALRILGLVGVASIAACNGGSGGGAGASAPSAATGTASAGSTAAHAGAGGMIGAGTTIGSGGMGGMGGPIFDASIGSGGSGGSGGGSAPPTQADCFDWPPEGGFPLDAVADGGEDAAPMLPFDAGPPTDACPTNVQLIVYEIVGNSCIVGGWDPYAVVSGPTRNGSNQCCYVMDLRLCISSGRPYLEDDLACLSPLAQGDRGWAPVPAHPACDGLTAEERASLAEAWAADALREHASVASFSRFSLELLAVGAPAGLVEQAHRAALDEIRHAELCFALASAYAGEALAPGRFPLGSGALASSDLAALAASTVKEGCVGETLAAVTAAEQLARATDPAVRAALAQIAADEARHAELAWQTVAWAVRTGGGDVRAAVAQAFVEMLVTLGGSRVTAFTFGGAETPQNPPGVAGSVEALEAHGRLDAATAARVVASALADVVGPSARALLAAAPVGARVHPAATAA